LGGPMVRVPNGPTIPLPNISLEHQRGINERADWQVGTHLLAPVFGAVGLHLGGSYLLMEASGRRPHISVSNRLFLFSNHLDDRKPDDARRLWAADELQFVAGWDEPWGGWGLSISEHVDFGAPDLLLEPSAFVIARIGPWNLSGELSWYGAGLSNAKAVLHWAGIADTGAIGLGLGVSRRFGATQ